MSSNKKPSILVVEDNPADVQLFALALEEANLDCELTVLRDGGEALAWVRRAGEEAGQPIPDIAVIDLNLPKNDGIEVLDAMHRCPVLAWIPKLILSSSPSPVDIARATAFPNTRYLTKPCFLDQYGELGRAIVELLQRPRGGHMTARS
jgi:chemotaxis family two-component system response regulator Rcp1